MRAQTLTTVFLVSLGAVAAVRLPQWLKPCYRDDPNTHECAVQHGNEAIPLLIKGDKKFSIPVLDPLNVTELRIDKDATNLGLGLVLTDLSFTGLTNSQLMEYRTDFENEKLSFLVHVPRIMMLSLYEIAGQILLLPITGKGPANITCLDADLKYEVGYDLEKRENGKQYMVLKKGLLKLNASRAYIKLENLFNGNKLLGENMNTLLNENWREIFKEIGPALAEALGEVMKRVFAKLVDYISFDEFHPYRPH